jgi:hypothetical protein
MRNKNNWNELEIGYMVRPSHLGLEILGLAKEICKVDEK